MSIDTQGLEWAVKFHETYERLAPIFGYETRTDTRQFESESKNGRLMIAVCGEIIPQAEEAAYRAGLEAAAGVLREWAGHYPTDVFPEDGKSVDCQSAKFARHLCREIEIDIHALASGAERETP